MFTHYRFLSSFALWVSIQWRRNINTKNTKARKVNGVKKEVRQSVRDQIHWSKTSLLLRLLVRVTSQFDFLSCSCIWVVIVMFSVTFTQCFVEECKYTSFTVGRLLCWVTLSFWCVLSQKNLKLHMIRRNTKNRCVHVVSFLIDLSLDEHMYYMRNIHYQGIE